jgi:hypothetical protein
MESELAHEQSDDIFSGYGIEVVLSKPEDFLKIKETLTRIGVASKKEKALTQSCHILHKRGRYVILHFKELFLIDGREGVISEDDLARRNSIVKLINEWGLVRTVNPITGTLASMRDIKVISHKERSDWKLVSKYKIGHKRT